MTAINVLKSSGEDAGELSYITPIFMSSLLNLINQPAIRHVILQICNLIISRFNIKDEDEMLSQEFIDRANNDIFVATRNDEQARRIRKSCEFLVSHVIRHDVTLSWLKDIPKAPLNEVVLSTLIYAAAQIMSED